MIILKKTIDQCKFKPKLMWKELKALIGNKQNNAYNGIDFEEEQGGVKSIADPYNNFFVESVKMIVNSIPKTTPRFKIHFDNTYKLIHFTLIQTDDLRQIVSDMNK